MATSQEVKIDLCFRHKDIDLGVQYQGYRFNPYLCFPAKECRVTDCQEEAFYTLIGVNIPDRVGQISRQNKFSSGTYEIFREAKSLMVPGTALEKLTYYLKTRVIPTHHKEFTADKILHHHAALLLNKLKIPAGPELTDQQIHLILTELNLYPEE